MTGGKKSRERISTVTQVVYLRSMTPLPFYNRDPKRIIAAQNLKIADEVEANQGDRLRHCNSDHIRSGGHDLSSSKLVGQKQSRKGISYLRSPILQSVVSKSFLTTEASGAHGLALLESRSVTVTLPPFEFFGGG